MSCASTYGPEANHALQCVVIRVLGLGEWKDHFADLTDTQQPASNDYLEDNERHDEEAPSLSYIHHTFDSSRHHSHDLFIPSLPRPLRSATYLASNGTHHTPSVHNLHIQGAGVLRCTMQTFEIGDGDEVVVIRVTPHWEVASVVHDGIYEMRIH